MKAAFQKKNDYLVIDEIPSDVDVIIITFLVMEGANKK